MPPLHERLADVPAICRAVIGRIARDAGVATLPTLMPEVERRLLRYAFPGNVLELENLLHRALALASGPAIGADDLGLADAAFEDTGPGADRQPLAVAEEPLPSELVAYLDEVERAVLQRALERHRYNRTAAGASLGLSLRQMRYRMARGCGVSWRATCRCARWSTTKDLRRAARPTPARASTDPAWRARCTARACCCRAPKRRHGANAGSARCATLGCCAPAGEALRGAGQPGRGMPSSDPGSPRIQL